MRHQSLHVITCLAVLALTASSAQAQGPAFGLLAGVNLSEVNVSGDERLNVLFVDRLDVSGGVFAEWPVSVSLRFRPEVLLSRRGTVSDEPGTERRLRLTYLDVPLLLRYVGPPDQKVGLHVFGGPYVSVLQSARRIDLSNGAESRVSVKPHFSPVDVGWLAGFALNAYSLDVEVRYAGGVKTIAEDASLGGLVPVAQRTSDLTFRNRGFSFLIGYRVR